MERPPEPTVPDERVDTTSEEEEEDTVTHEIHQGQFTYDNHTIGTPHICASSVSGFGVLGGQILVLSN